MPQPYKIPSHNCAAAPSIKAAPTQNRAASPPINSALLPNGSALPLINSAPLPNYPAPPPIKSALLPNGSTLSPIKSVCAVAAQVLIGQAQIAVICDRTTSIMLPIDTLLSDAQVAIENALNNPDILNALKDFGYTTARIQTGKTLYNTATAAQIQQTTEAGDQIAATAAVNDAWETAKKSYIRFIKIARIAFKRSPGVSTQLDLGGTRKRTLSGWLAQTNQFYASALANKTILSGLKEFGITKQKLKAGLAEVKAVEAANLAQEKEKGEAQAATQKRDAAIDELQDWLSDYLAIAKIALEENPQLLEGLGILQRT